MTFDGAPPTGLSLQVGQEGQCLKFMVEKVEPDSMAM
eukprot:COSAG02_NODE_35247_length_471_cov_1.026882_2_plen_36_part_01